MNKNTCIYNFNISEDVTKSYINITKNTNAWLIWEHLPNDPNNSENERRRKVNWYYNYVLIVEGNIDRQFNDVSMLVSNYAVVLLFEIHES